MKKLLLLITVIYCAVACADAPPPQPVVAPVAPAHPAGCFAAGNPCVAVTGTTVNIGGNNCCSGSCTNGICQ